MAQVSTALAIPGGIVWNEPWGTTTSHVSRGDVESTHKTHIQFRSKYKTFQVQWRLRRRLTPASVEALPDTDTRKNSTGADVWEEWPDMWSGDDIDNEAAHLVADLTYSDGNVICKADFSTPYDHSDYDLWEVQIRVRAWDSYTLNVSEWGYRTLRVAFLPTISTLSAAPVAGGGATLTVDTDWQRSDLTARLKLYSGQTVQVEDVGPDFTLDIPAADVSDGKARIKSLAIGTVDVARVTTIREREVTLSDEPATTLPDPSITWDGMTATLTSTGDDYASVNAAAVWEDARGIPHSETIEASHNGTTWTLELDSPPYDIPITWRISVVGSNGTYKTVTETRTLESHGCYTWTYQGEVMLSLRLGVEAQHSVSPEGDSIKLAGAELPISRHGVGATRTIETKGYLLIRDNQDYLPELEQLREPHDWVYRAPGGERCKVIVTSYQYSRSTGRSGQLEVTIDMSEVG